MVSSAPQPVNAKIPRPLPNTHNGLRLPSIWQGDGVGSRRPPAPLSSRHLAAGLKAYVIDVQGGYATPIRVRSLNVQADRLPTIRRQDLFSELCFGPCPGVRIRPLQFEQIVIDTPIVDDQHVT